MRDQHPLKIKSKYQEIAKFFLGKIEDKCRVKDKEQKKQVEHTRTDIINGEVRVFFKASEEADLDAIKEDYNNFYKKIYESGCEFNVYKLGKKKEKNKKRSKRKEVGLVVYLYCMYCPM